VPEGAIIASGLADVFAPGSPVEVSGSSPFLLTGASDAYLVTSGRIELFSVAVADGETTGPRQHFHTAQVGDLLFGAGFGAAASRIGLLAVGPVGTRLLRLSRKELCARMAEADPETVVTTVERWVLGLSRGSVRAVVAAARANTALAAGARVSVAAGDRVRAKSGVVWVRHLAGSSLYLDVEDVPPSAGSMHFPLVADTWLLALGGTKIEAVATASLVGRHELWDDLDDFTQTLVRCEAINQSLAAADELNRLERSAENDAVTSRRAVEELAHVLSGGWREQAPALAADRLLAACQVVGQAAGVIFKAPPRLAEGVTAADPVGEIARASKIRFRPVRLDGRWWELEHGPLLAFLGGERPVALLPGHRAGYRMVEPGVGGTIDVSEAVARGLDAIAFSFFRPFPTRPLAPLDLVRFARLGLKRDGLTLLLAGCAGGLIELLVPLLTGNLVDGVIPAAARAQLLPFAALLTAAAVVSALFLITRAIATLRIQTTMANGLQAALWDRLLSLPLPFFRRYSAGDLADRMNGVNTARDMLTGAVVGSILSGAFSMFSAALLFVYDTTFAFAGLGVALLAVVVTIAATHASMRYRQAQLAAQGKLTGTTLDLLGGVGKLRVACAEVRAFAVWARGYAVQRRLALAAGSIANVLKAFTLGYPVVSSMILFTVLLSLNDRPGGGLTTGEFLAFNAAMATFLAGIMTTATSLTSVLDVGPLLERARPILETVPEIDVSKSDPGQLSGRIEVVRLSFHYREGEPDVLRDVNIAAVPGQFIALVGPSGSGKSTLLRMLLGFEAPSSGLVTYDGQNLALLDQVKVRRQIGVVLQQGRLMAGDIFHNIVGASGHTVEEAWEAARMAGLDADLHEMPMGIHSYVSEGGTTLSGGQRQRLLIARAIVGRPRMIFFDEATSALDNRTQAIVSESLERLHATRIVIAHRLSTIINADRVYFLQQGRVVQVGRYEELLAAPGPFAEFARRQVI
jgi:NHLM bacteriocin system ABC transporter ATP-binding protein